MSELLIRPYARADEAELVEIWERARIESSAGDHRFDLGEMLRLGSQLFLVGEREGRVVASVFGGYDGHRGWIYRLAVDPQQQRQGFGRRMLEAAVDGLRELGCSKVNLQIRGGDDGVIRFYEAVGFSHEDRVSMGRRLFGPADAGAAGGIATAQRAQPVLPKGHFADRLIARIREVGHPLCVGLDPHLDRIPAPFRRGSMVPGDPQTAAAVEEFLLAFLDRVGERAAVAKPQSAFYEVLGGRGMQVLARVVERARGQGMQLVIDAKRGDIGSTAEAYAAAYLGPEAAVPGDALTVNPYLGTETLAPYLEHVDAGGKGILVLVKTSNPGSAEFLDRSLEGAPLFEAVAGALVEDVAIRTGPETGWSSIGVVVGATMPEHAQRVRERLPRALFLVPGYGAQKGSARDAVRGFSPGPGGRLEGGFVNSSRGLLFPEPSATAAAWERAVDEALSRAIEELAEATRG